MIKPMESPEQWAKRYSLSMDTIPCKKCGVQQVLSVPFAYKKWRGLQAEPHDCGEMYRSSVARSVDEDWNEAVSALFDSIK